MSRSLLRSTSLVSLNTCLSRILGFARDMIFAHYFGAAGGFDAFIVAFKIPNFMRRLFAEGAFSQAFVPVLSQYRQQATHEEVRTFIDDMTGTLGSVLLLVVILAVAITPLIVTIFAPGFVHDALRFALASSMLRITFPYLLFISITALCGAILNSYDNFGVPAFTPVLLNMTLIVMAFLSHRLFAIPVFALAWGVFAAGIIQLLFQLPFLYRKRLLPRPRINFRDPGVRRVLKLMGPAIFGVSVAQISLLVDTIFASFLKVGSVSWLYYSDRLMNFPLGVFGIAIATVVLPKLSRHHADKDLDGYSQTLDWSLRLLLLIGVPASIGIFILAGPLLSTLFLGGAFNRYDVLMSRQSLMAFAVGIQSFMLIKVLASGFYARQNIKTPVKIAVIAVICNMIFNAIFVFPLAHAGLALATSLAAIINAGLLLFALLKSNIYHPQAGWVRYFLRLCFANVVLAIFLVWGSGHVHAWLMNSHWWRISHLGLLVVIGIMLYFSCLYASGVRVKHFRV